MNGPYTLYEGSPVGASEIATYVEPDAALHHRDSIPNSRLRVYFVVGDDTDPPETGTVEWCESCGDVAVLESVGYCPGCGGGE